MRERATDGVGKMKALCRTYLALLDAKKFLHYAIVWSMEIYMLTTEQVTVPGSETRFFDRAGSVAGGRLARLL